MSQGLAGQGELTLSIGDISSSSWEETPWDWGCLSPGIDLQRGLGNLQPASEKVRQLLKGSYF